MTALTQDFKADRFGEPDEAFGNFAIQPPVEANVICYAGGMAAIDGNGNVLPAGTAVSASGAGLPGTWKVIGRFERQADNRTATTGGAAGAITAKISQGAYYYNTPSSGADQILAANKFQLAYVIDDNTVGLTDGGGTRAVAGPILDVASNGRVAVGLGTAVPYASASQSAAADSAFTARAVVTTLQAYTGSTTGTLTETANGAISAADGVTLAVGDIVLVPEGITNLVAASDAGPYEVQNLGGASAKWVLVRPSWWSTGGAMSQRPIDVSGEGTQWGGIQWRSFAAKGSVVDTTAPQLFPRGWVKSVTLVTGFATVTGLPIRSTSASGISFVPTNFNGAASTVSYRTGAYASGGAATVAGSTGTGGGGTQASVSITALVAAGTFNTSDVGTGLITCTNW